jgi:cbb3-type cytochrome oxidase subunit 3
VRSVLDAGFVFWGLFLVFALILVAYLFWMLRAEGTEASSAPVLAQPDEEVP